MPWRLRTRPVSPDKRANLSRKCGSPSLWRITTLSLFLMLCALGCAGNSVATKTQVVTIKPPAALLEHPPPPSCRLVLTSDLVDCLLEYADSLRQALIQLDTLKQFVNGAVVQP